MFFLLYDLVYCTNPPDVDRNMLHSSISKFGQMGLEGHEEHLFNSVINKVKGGKRAGFAVPHSSWVEVEVGFPRWIG